MAAVDRTLTIKMDAEMHAQLMAITENEGRTMNAVIREALRNYLAARES